MNFQEWALSYDQNGRPIEVAEITRQVVGGRSIISILEIINYESYEDLFHRKLGSPIVQETGKRTENTFEWE
jgi:hypothetical protein